MKAKEENSVPNIQYDKDCVTWNCLWEEINKNQKHFSKIKIQNWVSLVLFTWASQVQKFCQKHFFSSKNSRFWVFSELELYWLEKFLQLSAKKVKKETKLCKFFLHKFLNRLVKNMRFFVSVSCGISKKQALTFWFRRTALGAVKYFNSIFKNFIPGNCRQVHFVAHNGQS